MANNFETKIELKQLCDTLENVAKARGSKEKTQILQAFFDVCRNIANKLKAEYPESDVSLYPILRLILPNNERQRGPHNLKQVSLAKLYSRVYYFTKNSDNYKKLINYREPASGKFVGNDFAERAYWILNKRLPQNSTGLTIARINTFFDDICRKNATMQEKVEAFRILFQQITGFEMKWITRIVLKDLRLGVGTQKILDAYHQDANEMLVTKNLYEICKQLNDPKTKIKCGIEIFSHFKPMLLEKCTIEDVEKLFHSNDLYYAQTKFDGERSQLHMMDRKFKYFTRNGYDITKRPGYGENGSSGFLSGVFTRHLNPNCHSFILDGELVGWHKEKKTFGTKGMNFDVKNLSTRSDHQPCFIVFDVILHNDKLLVDMSYKDRLKLLDDMFTEEEGSLIKCQSTLISNREELEKAFFERLHNEEEGLVVKKYDMKYKPNVRNGGDCYKIKAEYSDDLVQDIDLIILGGYYGEGKYVGMIRSFMLGVAEPASNEGENPSKFFSIVSVSTGIGDQMLREFQTKFSPYWTKERPDNIVGPKGSQPNVWIRPEHSMILKIRATEMVRNKEYPIGYSLRFPRVVDIRSDKSWYSTCTTLELLSLVKDRNVIQKLTKRETTIHNDDETVSKFRKTTAQSKSIEYNAYKERIVTLTRLLDGKEICVINGIDELTKEQIEKILLQHSAKVVQYPMDTTFCVIVGNNKTMRGKEVVNTGKYDVVTLDWFKRITDRSNWASLSDFLPWELLCSREATRRQLKQNYDKYYDNFFVDADEESLKRSLDKIAESLADHQFTIEQKKEMDKELFNGNVSRYSLFRDITGFFEHPSCCEKYKFRFMSGTVKDYIDNTITHIFVEDSKTDSVAEKWKLYKQMCIKIVQCKWIDDCFQNGQICEIGDYLVDLYY